MSFDPELIMAYVDGELDLVTAKRIERAAADDTALAARIAAERALKARLAAHFDPVLAEPVPERLRAPIETVRSIAPPPVRRRLWLAQGAAIAASLAIGLLLGPSLIGPAPGPVRVAGETLVADGTLEAALDRQLASAQDADAPVRIGLSFASRDGTLCRTFEARALSGIACRNQDSWAIRQSFGGIRTGGYRQAGSGALAEAAAAMMAGDPLDAAAERAARDGGWSPR